MTPLPAIQTLVDAYQQAYRAQDATGCAAVFTHDASVLSSFAPPVTGRDEIAAAHLDWFTYGEEDKVMRVTDCAATGDIGWCLIHYTATVPQPNGSRATEAGQSLNALARQPGGGYLIRHTCLVHQSDS